MSKLYTVRGLDREGFEWFYTGKAGSGWLSRDRSDAFPYSLEGARRKAAKFNDAFILHDFWFIAVPKIINQN